MFFNFQKKCVDIKWDLVKKIPWLRVLDLRHEPLPTILDENSRGASSQGFNHPCSCNICVCMGGCSRNLGAAHNSSNHTGASVMSSSRGYGKPVVVVCAGKYPGGESQQVL